MRFVQEEIIVARLVLGPVTGIAGEMGADPSRHLNATKNGVVDFFGPGAQESPSVVSARRYA